MTKPRPGFIAVDRRPRRPDARRGDLRPRRSTARRRAPPDPVGAALDDADLAFVASSEARVEMRMRRAGLPRARRRGRACSSPPSRPPTGSQALLREQPRAVRRLDGWRWRRLRASSRAPSRSPSRAPTTRPPRRGACPGRAATCATTSRGARSRRAAGPRPPVRRRSRRPQDPVDLRLLHPSL